METNTKILYETKKTTKDGRPYKIVYAVVTIEGQEFMKKFYLFDNKAAPQ